MDQRIAIKEALTAPTSSKITICGIIQKTLRETETITLVVNDGSTVTPILAKISTPQPKDHQYLSQGSTIQLHGQVNHDDSPSLDVNDYTIIGPADPHSFPLALETQSPDFLNRNPHLRIRTPNHALIARFRSSVVSALTNLFDSHRDGPFYQVHLPILTWTDCEGGAEVFAAPTQHSKRKDAEMNETFFGARRFLNVSAVFHAEAFVQGLDRTWTLAPCWRAERAETDRHLAEFWMLEVAVNYIETLDPLYQLIEEVIRGTVSRLQESVAGKEVLAQSGSGELLRRWEKLLHRKWQKITFAEATRLLEPVREAKGCISGCQSAGGAQQDLTEDEEKYLCDHFDSPVFLTHFPSEIRLFQAKQSVRSIDDLPPGIHIDPAQTTEAFDLLLPGIGEICSGGLREHRLDVLVDTMRKKRFLTGWSKERPPDRNAPADAQPYPYLHPGEDLRSLDWFADLRRWGTSPHGGFGIGFERLLHYLMGTDSLKDVISFPRYRGVCGC
ncbi:asparaginyl-tRNA synthetase [Aspergillus nanangensis]|uniref:Asparaginyl-tRNA synthetase n=1 Tax=Aspergillus nanangensis TaxID=2582783 RepID=A0AAD4CWJ0_ASPNN|nr:asparaginyl-tRNA synthetase [Aspergillus nanangensis]